MNRGQREDIETYILYRTRWIDGFVEGQNAFAERRVMSIQSLPIANMKPCERTEAARILNEKYHIPATVKDSKSINCVVLRVGPRDFQKAELHGLDDDVKKLYVARKIANPTAWRQNKTVMFGNYWQAALNLPIPDNWSVAHVNYAQSLLEEWRISNSEVYSRSLGTQDEKLHVLRVEGNDAINRLKQAVPTLREIEIVRYPAPGLIDRVRNRLAGYRRSVLASISTHNQL